VSRSYYGDLHDGERVRRSCGKTRYRTKAIAIDARRSLGPDGQDLRIYGCPRCGGHHLTSHLTKTVRP
jgi:hypothetical protein